VALVERYGLAAGTSSAGQGGLGFGVMSDDLERSMQLLGMDAYKRFVAEGHDIGYRPGGSLLVAQAEQAPAIAARTLLLQQAGLPIEWLDGFQLREAEPGLAPEWVGATLIRDAPVVFPMRVVRELARAARNRGADIHVGVGPARIELKLGRIHAVRTDLTRIPTSCAVVAAGVWTPDVVSNLGIRVPIACLKGHVLVVETDGIVLRHQVSEAAYEFTAREPSQTLSSQGPTFATVLEQMTDRTLLVGSSRETSPIDLRANTQDGAMVAARATGVMPGLARHRVLRMYAGLRPQTPDGAPLLGPTRAVEGLWLAAGHGGEGINQSLMSGQLIADLMCGRSPAIDAARLSPDRFTLAR
jgi:sarcosine oxidase subunit beta